MKWLIIIVLSLLTCACQSLPRPAACAGDFALSLVQEITDILRRSDGTLTSKDFSDLDELAEREGLDTVKCIIFELLDQWTSGFRSTNPNRAAIARAKYYLERR